MGLDMYLTKEIFIGAGYSHREIEGSVNLTMKGNPIAVDVKKLYEIVEKVGYWRKANQIHKWFVDNVQGGVDDQEAHDVGYGELMELKNLCVKALETKDSSLLLPQPGFFFGSTEIDEGYWEDLRETISIIDSLDPDGDYVYRASW